MTRTDVVNKTLAYTLLFVVVSIPIALAVLILQRATLLSLPPLIAALTVLTAGVWTLARQPVSKGTLLVSLVCFAWTAAYASQFLAYSASQDRDASWWHGVGYGGLIVAPVVSYHWARLLDPAPPPTAVLWGGYAAAGICVTLLAQGLLLDEATLLFWGYAPNAGVAYPVFLLYGLTVSAMTIRLLWRACSGEPTWPLRQPTMLLWTYGLSTLATLDMWPVYGFTVYPAGLLLGVTWCVALPYACSQPAPRSVITTVRRPDLLAYIEAFSLLFLFYVVILLVVQLFTGVYSYELACILIAISTIFAGLIASIQKHMEAVVQQAFFKEKEAYETLTEFSRAMVSILDLPALTQRILTTLEKVLGLRTISLFLLDQEKHHYAVAGSSGHRPGYLSEVAFAEGAEFPHYLWCTKSIVIRRRKNPLPSNRAAVMLDQHLTAMAAELCLPLINKDRLIGFINLGPRWSARAFSDQELDLLTTLAQNAAVALDNAILYTDLKRSQMVMRRTDRLRSLETIAGGFAHEIRNPLTSIKTFIQLAPGRRQDEEFITRFSDIVIEDVYRIERLIHEILDYARYREPKFVAEDVNDVVSSCLYFIEVKASSKTVMIDKQLASDLPRVHLDRQQIKQVLLNLYLNALDAMERQGGRLTVTTKRLDRVDGVWVQIEVTDTGVGITPANLDHIFDPFYTTKHESGEREGTGLGLTIAHEIIQEHRGSIEVESTPGVGTTFTINLRTDPTTTTLAQEHEEHEKTRLAH